MQSTIWRQFHIETPDDWELLQFSRAGEAGRCAFADRYRFRLEFSWREVRGAPDFERMLSDYGSRLEEEGFEDLKPLARGAWMGMEGRANGRLVIRFGRHFPEPGCLAETVLIWPKQRDVALERRILDSIRHVPPENGSARWRAFGMDLRTSADYELEQCLAQPAKAELLFSRKNGRLEERFGRFGMVDEWLNLPLPDWLEGRFPARSRITGRSRRTEYGHDIARAEGLRAHLSVRELIGGRRHMAGAAWICPRDGRLYSVTAIRPESRTNPVSLSCCGNVEVTL